MMLHASASGKNPIPSLQLQEPFISLSSSDVMWHGWLRRQYSPSSLFRSTLAKITFPLHTPGFFVFYGRSPPFYVREVLFVVIIIILLLWLTALLMPSCSHALRQPCGRQQEILLVPLPPRSTSESGAPCHYMLRGPSFWKSNSLQVFVLCCDWLTQISWHCHIHMSSQAVCAPKPGSCSFCRNQDSLTGQSWIHTLQLTFSIVLRTRKHIASACANRLKDSSKSPPKNMRKWSFQPWAPI